MRKLLFLLLLCVVPFFFQANHVQAAQSFILSDIRIYPNCSGATGSFAMSYTWEGFEPIVSFADRFYVNDVLMTEHIDNPDQIASWNGIASSTMIEHFGQNFGSAPDNSIYRMELTWNGELFSIAWNCTTGEIVSSNAETLNGTLDDLAANNLSNMAYYKSKS